ncbi:hypothetical protein, conserved [Eimeria acervulina]|uniref:SNF2 N-terminal domain-containing protein n=1 Tax=Eimeria acervulina TaxID=5801 RepID=U6GVA7_EIMAC|nr:hypothetical protein, conserved [Eimeria acervulina]CDI84191.1 hypothetical protein, conserved [Eimeria acervulina]
MAIGGFEGEIGQAIPQADFISGRCFTNNASVDLVAAAPVQLLLQPPAALRRQQPAPRKAAACAKEAEDSDGTREKDLFLEEALQEDKGASLTPAAAAAAAPDGASAAATAGGRPLPLLGDYLSVHLRPHQREGLEWMYSRVSEGGGCILADSMGLGKTLQALALLCSLLGLHASQQQNSAAFKALIVCPTSLKGSWKKGKSRACIFVFIALFVWCMWSCCCK